MPHVCVRCGNQYGDGSKELLKGCPCGSHFFYFVKQENMGKWQAIPKMTKQEADEVERDIKDIIGVRKDEEVPIILDIETITVKGPGKYVIDLLKLFSRKEPIIYKIKDGKYYIDLTTIE